MNHTIESAARADSVPGKRKTPSELRIEQLKRKNQDGGSSQRSFPKVPRVLADAPVPPQPPKPKFSLSKLKETFSLDVPEKPTTTTRQSIFSIKPNHQPSTSRFKSVVELSATRVQHQTSCPVVDMEKAIKGLGFVKDKPIIRSASAPDIPQFDRPANTEYLHVPLDLSLKKNARFISPKSFHWCHRLGVRSRSQGLKYFIQGESNNEETEMELFWKGLHSWVYPQISLSPEILNGFIRGGEAEKLLASQIQRNWEDAFHSLYLSFRANRDTGCNIFYFCTNQFVVLFTGGGVGGRSVDACGAYVSRSTRRLRDLFQQQNIQFSMPHCKYQPSATTQEELQDLSEFEKMNPGQTRMVDPLARINNSIESLLAIDGRENVHRLYDFLLNYRHFFGGTMGLPTLYSPTAFHNASLKVPELISKQLVIAEETMQKSFTLEVKDALLPPWVISRVCQAIQKLHKEQGFEVSFTTEMLTEGLNVAQTQDGAEEQPTSGFGQPVALGPSVIRQLKYSKDSSRYTAATL